MKLLSLILLSLLLPALAEAGVGSAFKFHWANSVPPPDWLVSNAINNITVIDETVYPDTGTQRGVTGAGVVSANTFCDASAGTVSMILVVDAATVDTVYCNPDDYFSASLSWPVAAGPHSIQIKGVASNGATFSANNFSIPLP